MNTITNDYTQLAAEYDKKLVPINITRESAIETNSNYLVVKRVSDNMWIKVHDKQRDIYSDQDYSCDDMIKLEQMKSNIESGDEREHPYYLLSNHGNTDEQIIDKFKTLNESHSVVFKDNFHDLIESSSRFPQICLETENYIGFEWFQGEYWEPCTISDLVTLDQPVDTKTSFGTKIIEEIINIFESSTKFEMPVEFIDLYNELINPEIRSNYAKYMGIDRSEKCTVLKYNASELAKAINVKRMNGKIVDWKYTQVHKLILNDDGQIVCEMFDALKHLLVKL